MNNTQPQNNGREEALQKVIENICQYVDMDIARYGGTGQIRYFLGKKLPEYIRQQLASLPSGQPEVETEQGEGIHAPCEKLWRAKKAEVLALHQQITELKRQLEGTQNDYEATCKGAQKTINKLHAELNDLKEQVKENNNQNNKKEKE